jgi:hypothetical protein
MSTIPTQKPQQFTLTMRSEKLHPKHLSVVTKSLLTTGANIEDIQRAATNPFEITIKISGISKTQLAELIDTVESGTDFSLTSGA